MSDIVVPPLNYLETSAVTARLEEARFTALRKRIERLPKAGRLLLCTSLSTVEGLVATMPTASEQISAIELPRGVAPGRLIWLKNSEVVRPWILHAEAPRADRTSCSANWNPRLGHPSERMSALEVWRDDLLPAPRRFLTHPPNRRSTSPGAPLNFLRG